MKIYLNCSTILRSKQYLYYLWKGEGLICISTIVDCAFFMVTLCQSVIFIKAIYETYLVKP